ncbi:hypothetical protein Hydth_0540 [Hydrogenobacter thermophilus TK-6]|uniref:Uncharacterized protein n=1 Tax=Hydrogenobacter thermophilus (strain DSM 6534 / IAM 12695 / TK-6) TaxID=608538 RepID=D3DGQ2_HYDTT|nr:hypothetical protein [Hydrogenobacter thermophilus]ADO44940.1 hypothetical protein Hydth_0540 [Hydrogenobacter thermophilus TK-6]BAI69004.1 hypothetical protein HTH_0542 [Hydrogenobacter thermophilus TK-6]
MRTAHLRIVEKLLDYYRNPENWGKSLKQVAQAFGHSYPYILKCIQLYGTERFRKEKDAIYHEILSEASNIAIARLYEMLLSEDKEEFKQAQAEVRQWYKTVFGEKQYHTHEAGDKLSTLLSALAEIRQKYAK